MKTSSYLFAFALSTLCWIGTGCGHDHDHSNDSEHTEHNHDDHAGHDHDSHEGHDHGSKETDFSNANSKTAHGNGSEYTAMYVCPMHCKGSGGNEKGKCPTCGMEYVRFRDHIQDGHHHREN